MTLWVLCNWVRQSQHRGIDGDYVIIFFSKYIAFYCRQRNRHILTMPTWVCSPCQVPCACPGYMFCVMDHVLINCFSSFPLSENFSLMLFQPHPETQWSQSQWKENVAPSSTKEGLFSSTNCNICCQNMGGKRHWLWYQTWNSVIFGGCSD